MTEKKSKPETTGKIPKRIIPVRNPGEIVAKNMTSPSAQLFAEAKRLFDEEERVATIPVAKESLISEKISDSPPVKHRIAEQSTFGYPILENPASQTDFSAIRIAENEYRIADKTPFPAIKIADKKTSDSRAGQKTSSQKYEKTGRRSKGIFLRTDEEITKEFKKFCIDNNLEFAAATELAWHDLMTISDSRGGTGTAIKIALNNKELNIMWKTKPLIINLYFAYNQFFNKKPKWTTKDDRVAEIFNETDIRIIELGIIQTQMNLWGENATPTINGFRYYANEISRFIIYAESPEMLDAMLGINRRRWKETSGKTVDLDFLNETS